MHINGAGYAPQIKKWLEGIMFGKDGQEAHEWGYVVQDGSEK